MTNTVFLENTVANKKLLKQNINLIILSIIFMSGFVVGTFSISVCNDNSFYELKEYVNSYILFLKTSDYFTVLSKYLICFLSIVFINFIFGLSIVGNIFLFPFSFLYSFGFGSITSYFYKDYGVNGMAFFLVCVLPGLFLFSINYLLSLKHSIVFSKKLYLYCVKNKTEKALIFKNFLYKYIVHFILCIFCATVFSFFSSCFVEKFNL